MIAAPFTLGERVRLRTAIRLRAQARSVLLGSRILPCPMPTRSILTDTSCPN